MSSETCYQFEIVYIKVKPKKRKTVSTTEISERQKNNYTDHLSSKSFVGLFENHLLFFV